VIHILYLVLTIFIVHGVMLQVEVDGQVLGKGMGLTWDEAKMQVFYFLRDSHDFFLCEFYEPLFFIFSPTTSMCSLLRLLKRRLEV
jgi:hypothetical protein